MIAPIVWFLVMSLVGIGGLAALAVASSDREPQQIAALRFELAAKDRLIAALQNKAAALENLASERKKTLDVYRGAQD